MSYTKTTWSNGDVISAAKLNNAEGGIEANDLAISDLKSDLGDLDDLQTTAKNNLVAAINEAAQSGGGGGGSVTVDSALSTTSTNPVRNSVITNALNGKANASDIPTVPVQSVNGATGAVVLDADDVGAIAAPSSATSGQFLVYNGSAWVAQTVPSASGVNF